MNMRNWMTPITIGGFLLLSVTGILMFFHIDTGLNKLAHEWGGWIFVIGGLCHLWINFPAFKLHMKRPIGRRIMAVSLAVLAFSFVSLNSSSSGSPVKATLGKLMHAPLVALVPLANSTPEKVKARLEAAHIRVTDMKTDTIADLAKGDRGRQMHILQIVLK